MQRVALSAVVFGMCAAVLYGQQNRGSISGLVTDQASAAVAGAAIRVVNTDTGVASASQSDATGNYTIPFLPPGNYRVQVEAPGFANAVNPSVTLHAQQTLRLDFSLQVGSVQQTVQVTAEAPLLQRADTSVQQTISGLPISELPVLGNNLIAVAILGTGVAQSENVISGTLAGALTGGLNIDANGIRDSANQYTMDGANINVGMYNYPGFVPPPEATAEFTVQRGNYDAEYGQFAGAHANFILKSGTNSFHGTVWEYFQNSDLNARNFFSPTVPVLHYNQFGGILTGPIIKNKTFFMASYQGLRQAGNQFIQNIVPTGAQRDGDLSHNVDGTPEAPIADPAGGVFSNNVIPASRISPTAAAALKLLAPLPNQPGAVNWGGFLSTPVTENDVLVKIDHSFSERDHLNGRYILHKYSYNQFTSSAGDFTLLANPLDSKNAALIETHTFSPSVVLASRVSWNRITIDNIYPAVTSSLNTRQLFNLDLPSGIGPGDPMNAYPFFTISGYTALGEQGNSPLYQPDENYEIASDLAVIEGRHSLKFGFELDRYRSARNVNDNTNGVLNFSPTNPAGTGNAFGDFLLGLPTSSQISLSPITVDLRRMATGLYLQDKWTATPRLTVDVGLRAELDTPTNEHFGRISLFDFTPPGSFLYRTPGSPLYQQSLVNFAPRLGVAYQLTSHDVIRSSLGIFYSETPQLNYTFAASNPPYIVSEAFTSSKAAPLTLPNPFPLGNVTAGGVPSPQAIQAFQKLPSVYEWNFDIQHSFGQNMLLDAGYVGNHGIHFGRSLSLNAPYIAGPGAIQLRRPLPKFGPISYFSFDDSSSYEALQARLEKRFSNGLQFLVAYTWSKSLDLSSNELISNNVSPTNWDLQYGHPTTIYRSF